MRGELQVATAGLSWLASLPGPNGLCLTLAYPPAAPTGPGLSGVRPGALTVTVAGSQASPLSEWG
jgi:hypothetical protein